MDRDNQQQEHHLAWAEQKHLGLVWPSWSEIRLDNAVVDIGWRLRYYLQNFVVRFDMGFSNEGMGIYFNFGHVF